MLDAFHDGLAMRVRRQCTGTLGSRFGVCLVTSIGNACQRRQSLIDAPEAELVLHQHQRKRLEEQRMAVWSRVNDPLVAHLGPKHCGVRSTRMMYDVRHAKHKDQR